MSLEAHRINLLACYNLLPYFDLELLQHAWPEIAKLTFMQLETFLFLKLTDNKSRFYSPTRLAG